jgi:RND superfamily putative drug exporter
MAVGLLIDTFLVRTILVPALLSLVGPRSAWPGNALRETPTGPTAPAGRPPADRPAADSSAGDRPTAPTDRPAAPEATG